MMPNYRRGFRAEAERLALDVRTGLGLGAYAALDPLTLARDLEVPVLALSALTVPPPGKDLVAGLGQAVGLLLGTEAAAFSAMTVFLGSRRVIVHNDAHNPGRQASDIGHELAHGLLLHSPTPALDDRGCRDWDPAAEAEADYLAGALLIPAKAAWWIAKQRKPHDEAARQYGCSAPMVRWRVNITGASKRLVG